MLNRLFPATRKPQTWFRRARMMAFAAAAIISGMAAVFLAAFALGWVSVDQAIFAGFSLMPLLALVAIQAFARLQEIVTMRSGGLAIEMAEADE